MSEPIPFTSGDLEELQLELDSLAYRGEFWGTVLIAIDRDIVLHEAYGLADRENDRAITRKTVFNIASIGKQFTAVMILQLAQEGKLNLDQTIGRWIEDLPDNSGETVTVRHLLRMKSG